MNVSPLFLSKLAICLKNKLFSHFFISFICDSRFASQNKGDDIMKTWKSLIAIMAAFAFLIGLAACQTPAGRTAGEVVDDSTITTKAKTQLLADDDLSGFSISVKTFEGEVTLTGAVENHYQKARAEEIVQSVYGVRSVNNHLRIR